MQANTCHSHLVSSLSFVTKSLDSGRSVVLFAPTGCGAILLVETLEKQMMDIQTPRRIGLHGHPGAAVHMDRNSHEEGLCNAVRRDFLGTFIRIAQESPRPFLCALQARGPVPEEGDFLEAVLASQQCDGGAWPCRPQNIQVIALNLPEDPVDGPTIAWSKAFPDLVNV